MIVLLALNTILLIILLVSLAEISRRLQNLEQADADRVSPAPEPRTHRVEPPVAAAVVVPPTTPAPAVGPMPAAPAPPPTPRPIAPPLPAPVSRAAARKPEPEPDAEPADPWFSEERIGGAWLQNVGSVLVLLGVFFLFLWGYTTGRFGPSVLIAAGVALGGILVWRGDRTIRTVPGFGHALIGIGLGVAYLSLYSGHFVLSVFGLVPALVLLALAAVASILVAMRYRIQLIAVLGVLGAFVPWIASTLTGRQPDQGGDVALLAYMAAIDVVVFFLAARAGWSALAITATLLTTGTWLTSRALDPWSTPVQLGLCALYLGLGLALVPRFVAGATSGRRADLFSIALTPYCFVLASVPYLFAAAPATSAWILGGMAATYALAAAYVDARRPERDLWTQFVIASTAFLAAALERALGPELTPMAWCVQGVVLIALGLSPRGGAVRALGYLLAALGTLYLVPVLLVRHAAAGGAILTADSIRTAVAFGGLLLVARMLERHRDRLVAEEESFVPPATLTIAQACLGLWIGVHMSRIALLVAPDGGATALAPSLALALQALGWTVQGGGLVLSGLRGQVWKRVLGYGLATLAGVASLLAWASFPLWTQTTGMPLHALGLTLAEVLLVGVIVTERMQRAHARLTEPEGPLPRIAAVVLHLAWLAWTSAEAAAIARSMSVPADIAIVTAGTTSASWLFQAVVIFGLGWLRRSPFLRWLAIATFGLTLLKFLLLDLSRVDAFWRFVIAIAVGVVLLGVSYVYQRARRQGRSGLASPPSPATLRNHEHRNDSADPPRP